MNTTSRILPLLVLLSLLLSCNSKTPEAEALAQAERELDSLKVLLAAGGGERENTAPAPSATPEAAKESSAPATSSSGWTSIGNGFSYRGVRFSTEHGFTTAIGEILNESNKSYIVTLFTLNVYDTNRALIGTGFVGVENIGAGQVKSFQSLFTNEISSRASIGMTFDSGHGVTY